MKAKRLVEGQIVNQFFSHEKRREARSKGQRYDVKQFLTFPAGDIVDDPDCWKLCIGDNAVMVPFDDECRQTVLKAMSEPKRMAFLRNIKRQNTPELRKQMSKGHLEWLEDMLESYGIEAENLDAKPAQTGPDESGERGTSVP